MERKTSSGDISKLRNKYLAVRFWTNPANAFWEHGPYSESTKQTYRQWVRTLADQEMKTGKPNLIQL